MSSPLLLVAAHGGAGTSTLRQCLGFGTEIRRPMVVPGPGVVVVVTRTTASGLRAAQEIAIEHAPHMLDGLVLVADCPGKLPRPLADLSTLIAGGFANVWRIPFVSAWRLGATPDLKTAPAVVRALDAELRFAVTELHTSPVSERQHHRVPQSLHA